MPAKKSAKAKWPAMMQTVKNAVAADGTRQKKVSAAAKRKAIQFAGKDSRTYGHTSAAGKRAQARKDQKGSKGG